MDSVVGNDIYEHQVRSVWDVDDPVTEVCVCLPIVLVRLDGVGSQAGVRWILEQQLYSRENLLPYGGLQHRESRPILSRDFKGLERRRRLTHRSSREAIEIGECSLPRVELLDTPLTPVGLRRCDPRLHLGVIEPVPIRRLPRTRRHRLPNRADQARRCAEFQPGHNCAFFSDVQFVHKQHPHHDRTVHPWHSNVNTLDR